MRYFLTTNSTRSYNTGGLSFTFEPTVLERGYWLGVLAADEPAASSLAAAAFPQVSEITESEFEAEKKKGQQPVVSRLSSPVLPKSPRAAAAPVAEAVATTSKSSESAGLRVTDSAPPDEPLLTTPIRASRARK